MTPLDRLALAQFAGPENVAYLCRITGAAPAGVALFAEQQGRAVLAASPERHDMWAALRRLNTAFYDAVAAPSLPVRPAKSALRALAAAPLKLAAEPLHMQMFAADSLRPAGAPGLNNSQLFGQPETYDPTWSGTRRAMRYEGIPFWQVLSREGRDRDLNGTLGAGGREFESQVRRWDND
jgi:hypothetical protein